MTYLSFHTAAGHTLMINPQRQKKAFWDIQDAQVAESRLNEKTIRYKEYRTRLRRPLCAKPRYALSIVRSARKEMDWLSDFLDALVFAKLEEAILALADQPCTPRSKPKSLRWFLGDLRAISAADYPILYSVDEKAKKVRVLRIGYRRRWPKQK